MSKVPYFLKPVAIAVALSGLLGACAVYVPGPGPGPGYYRGGGGYYGAPAPYYRGYYGRPYFR
ncbi:hypothetical protein EDC65_1040 [Stella humosa]|uniref:Lipoprotein n=1 Tax=Stella humosa TaxID=94 RepID=A0A3N1MDQ3_9PROT|nr:hypothetical protein [Stella humosa]ROQ01853.1 hypothetical protein EDC65_1040 [Stella humosa]BBK32242.1 hypothetical protein STHU_28760 [Stella humosa]